jgi:hypothetical protein
MPAGEGRRAGPWRSRRSRVRADKGACAEQLRRRSGGATGVGPGTPCAGGCAASFRCFGTSAPVSGLVTADRTETAAVHIHRDRSVAQHA